MTQKTTNNKEREDRIYNEIVVDAYGADEQMMGWQSYLEDTLKFPFKARCIKARTISPLREGEIVTALDIVSGEETEKEIFVFIRLVDRRFGVPLSQILPIDADAKTKQAVEDWHYWIQKN